MLEYRTWRPESPRDVETSDRESGFLQNFRESIYSLGQRKGRRSSGTREDFLEYLRKLTGRTNPGGRKVCCTQQHQDGAPTLVECWVQPDPENGVPGDRDRAILQRLEVEPELSMRALTRETGLSHERLPQVWTLAHPGRSRPHRNSPLAAARKGDRETGRSSAVWTRSHGSR